jgi:plasmid stabilization system protein ParE
MPIEVRCSTLAADDWERIFRHLDKDNPTAARETVKAIYDGCGLLKNFPYRGRPGRKSPPCVCIERRHEDGPPSITFYWPPLAPAACCLAWASA